MTRLYKGYDVVDINAMQTTYKCQKCNFRFIIKNNDRSYYSKRQKNRVYEFSEFNVKQFKRKKHHDRIEGVCK